MHFLEFKNHYKSNQTQQCGCLLCECELLYINMFRYFIGLFSRLSELSNETTAEGLGGKPGKVYFIIEPVF